MYAVTAMRPASEIDTHPFDHWAANGCGRLRDALDRGRDPETDYEGEDVTFHVECDAASLADMVASWPLALSDDGVAKLTLTYNVDATNVRRVGKGE